VSSTHREAMGDGYYVTIQYCEEPGCDKYLGVNYPSTVCSKHKEIIKQYNKEARIAMDLASQPKTDVSPL
jgi:hypothetical protein